MYLDSYQYILTVRQLLHILTSTPRLFPLLTSIYSYQSVTLSLPNLTYFSSSYTAACLWVYLSVCFRKYVTNWNSQILPLRYVVYRVEFQSGGSVVIGCRACDDQGTSNGTCTWRHTIKLPLPVRQNLPYTSVRLNTYNTPFAQRTA